MTARHLSRLRVEAIDVTAADFRLRAVALVVGVDAVGGIGEPDGVVGFDDEVVGRVEALAVPFVGEHRDRAVDLGARDAARQMLAGHQPALIVDAVAVGIVGALAKHRDLARGLDEAHLAVVGDVRPDEIAARGEPRRPFRPARARPQPLDPDMAGKAGLEARIENDDVGSLDLAVIHGVSPFR